MKKYISMLLCFALLFSLTIMPANAAYSDNPECIQSTAEEITVYIPPHSSVPVPYSMIESGKVYQHNLGTLSLGQWVGLEITSNSMKIPVIAQLYTAYGANYSSHTLTTGEAYWQAKKEATHSILFTNDNNYGTNTNEIGEFTC